MSLTFNKSLEMPIIYMQNYTYTNNINIIL